MQNRIQILRELLARVRGEESTRVLITPAEPVSTRESKRLTPDRILVKFILHVDPNVLRWTYGS